MGWMTKVRFLAEAGIYLRRHVLASSKAQKTPTQWMPAVLSPGIKWSWREMTIRFHLAPRLRMRGAILQSPNTPVCRGAQLK